MQFSLGLPNYSFALIFSFFPAVRLSELAHFPEDLSFEREKLSRLCERSKFTEPTIHSEMEAVTCYEISIIAIFEIAP